MKISSNKKRQIRVKKQLQKSRQEREYKNKLDNDYQAKYNSVIKQQNSLEETKKALTHNKNLLEKKIKEIEEHKEKRRKLNEELEKEGNITLADKVKALAEKAQNEVFNNENTKKD